MADHRAAGVGERRHVRGVLRREVVGLADHDLAEQRAGPVHALRQHALARAVAGVGGVGDHEAVVRQRRHRGVDLALGDGRVDDDLAADAPAGRVEALGDHAEVEHARLVLVQPLPDHDEAAARERRDRGEPLLVGDRRVDRDLGADRRAVRGVELREDAGGALDVEVVLVGRLPDHHPAAADELDDLRRVLRARREAVDDAVGGARRRAVLIRRHRDVDEGGAGAEARAVRDVDGDARGVGVVAGVGVAERADQCLHRLLRRRGVERDLEGRPVRAVRDDRADDDAVDRDLRAHGHGGDLHVSRADLARDQPEAMLGGVVGRGELAVLGGGEVHRRTEGAAGREAALQRRDRHGQVGVDGGEACVDVGLLQRHRQRQADDFVHAEAREVRRVAEHALEHAVAGAVARRAGGGRREGHHEGAVRQRRDGRLELLAGSLDVDPRLAVEPRAVRRVDLHRDVGGAATRRVLGLERHREPAVAERGDGRQVLRAGAVLVDHELVAERRAGEVEEPPDHADAVAVLAAVVVPHHGEAAGGGDHLRRILRVRRLLVDAELAAGEGPVGVDQPREHAVGRAVAGRAAGRRGPDHHHPAVRELREVGLALTARDLLVDDDLAADGRPRRAEALVGHAVAVAVAGVGGPGYREAAVRQRRHRRVELGVGRGGVDHELPAHRRAGGVVALGENAEVVVAGVVAVDPLPHHDEAAADEAHHRGVLLRAGGEAVDRDLGTGLRPVRCIALGADRGPVAVLGRGGPHHHPAAAVERRRLGVVLGAGDEAVDPRLAADRDRPARVGRLRDPDLDAGRLLQRAVAVGEADRVGARGLRVVGAVDVGERPHHRLDPRSGGGGVEGDLEVGARRTVGNHGPHHDAADADLPAGQRHRALGRGDRRQRHRVLRVVVGRVVVLGVEARHEARDEKPPAVEARRVRVRHAHRAGRRQQHAGVRVVLGHLAHARQPLDHRGEGSGEVGGVADDLLADVAGSDAVVLPHRDIGAVRQRGERRPDAARAGEALRARDVGVDQLLAVHPAAVGREALGPDVGARARRRGGGVDEADHPAAVRQRGDHGRLLIARSQVVDAHLAAHGGACGGEALLVDPARGAVLSLRAPDHHEVPARQRRDLREGLLGGDLGVDAELAPFRRAERVEQPGVDVELAVGAGRDPHRDEAAVVQRRKPVACLVAGGGLVDELLAAHAPARGVEALDEHAVAGAVARRAGGRRGPAHHEAAVAERGEARVELVGRGLGVDHHLGLGGDRRAGGVVAAVDDAVAGAVERVVDPRHHEAAVGEPHGHRVELGVDDGLVDAELAAHRLAVAVVALGVDAEVEDARLILVAALPHHDVAVRRAGDGVVERRDRGVLLDLRAHGVDGEFAAHRAVHVRLGRDRDRHRHRLGRRAVAVLEQDGQLRAGPRVVGDVLIGQVLDQHLDRRGRRVRVQRHFERHAVGAARDGSHHGPVHGEVGAGAGHAAAGLEAQHVLAVGVLGREVVLGHALGDDRDDQPAAVESRAVEIGDRRGAVGVDAPGRGVELGLGEAAGRRHRLDRRRGARLDEGGRLAEQALEHAVAHGVEVRVGGEHRDEVAARQGRHVALVLIARGLLVDQDVAGQRDAVGIEAPGRHAVAAGVELAVEGVGGEGHHEAAVGRRGHLRVGLIAADDLVDLELGADRRAVALVDPRHHAEARAVGTVLVEHHHEAAAGQPGHVGQALRAHSNGPVDLELRAERRPVHGVALGKNADAAAVGALVDHHEAAAGQRRAGGDRRHLAVGLGPRGRGGDDEGRARGRAGGVVEPRADALVEAAVGEAVGEAHHEAAAGQARHRRIELGARDHVVDDELVSRGLAVRAEAPGHDAAVEVARIVLIGAGPDDDEAAVLGPRHRRLALLVQRGLVGAEWQADPLALRGVALGVDAALVAVLPDRAPDHHVGAVRQRRDSRLRLIPGGEHVDEGFGGERSVHGQRLSDSIDGYDPTARHWRDAITRKCAEGCESLTSCQSLFRDSGQ